MFENIGKKLKKVAIIIFLLGIIFSVVKGVQIMRGYYVDEEVSEIGAEYGAQLINVMGVYPISVVDGTYVVNLFGLFPMVAEENYQFVMVGVSVVLIGVALSWLSYLVLAGLGEVVQRSEDSINLAKKLNE
ncbi:MAG: hypothetical protein IKP32_04620 [Clostridia bacterium]|nr:hypothetical protein [Clostridia bacterium]